MFRRIERMPKGTIEWIIIGNMASMK
jgi:hypothetical protein